MFCGVDKEGSALRASGCLGTSSYCTLSEYGQSPSLNPRLLYCRAAGGGNSAGGLVMVVTGPEGPKFSPSSSG